LPKPWSADKTYRSIVSSLQDETSEWILYTNPQAKLNQFNWPQEDYRILGAFGSLAQWFRANSCTALYAGETDRGVEFAGLKSVCSLLDATVYTNGFRLGKSSAPTVHSLGLSIAHAVAFGHMDIGRGLIRQLAGCAELDTFKVGLGCVGPFCARLCSDGLGMANPLVGKAFEKLAAYEIILSTWKEPDPHSGLAPACLDACEYHVANSKMSNTEWHDFDERDAQLMPVELLAVLRLRELQGFPPVKVDHPLMTLPTANLYPIQPETCPDFVKAGIDKLRDVASWRLKGLDLWWAQ
jgi:hypothetical protein